MEKGFKNHKLISIVQEFEKLGTEYNINGIDRGKAIFFWRGKQELFEPIPRGSYRLEEKLGTLYLVITNTEELDRIERIQVGYTFASVSSKYEVEFNVEINVLKDKYNQAVEDIKTLYKYIQTNMMTADALNASVVLPQLDTDEVWVKTADGWRGFNIGSLEENIKHMLDEIKRLATQYKQEITELRDSSLQAIQGKFDSEVSKGKQEMTSTKELLISEITKKADEKVVEINSSADATLEKVTDTGNKAINAIEIQKTQATKEITQEKEGALIRVHSQGDTEVQRIKDTGIGGRLPKINTIKSLQTASYPLGEVVEVLGYHTAGDGAGHKRIIANEDDGSGVQLSNGLWANIVKNDRRKETSNKTFGVIGDSIARGGDLIWDFLKEQLFFKSYSNYAIAGTGIINTVDVDNFVTQSEKCGVHDFYFVWGGVNDYYSNNTYGNVNDAKEVESLCGRLKRIIYNLRQKNRKAKIFYISPVPYFGEPSEQTKQSGRQLADLSNLLKEVANSQACQTIELTSNLNFHKDIAWFYYTDYTHPNDEGRKVIMTYILQSILNPTQHGNYGAIQRSGDVMNGEFGTEVLNLIQKTKFPRFNFYTEQSNITNKKEDLILYATGGEAGKPRRGTAFFQGKELSLIFDIIKGMQRIDITATNPLLIFKNNSNQQIGYIGKPNSEESFYIYGGNTTIKLLNSQGFINNMLIQTVPNAIFNLNTPYHVEKMKQEGVYADFVSYMDKKTEFDNKKREEEKLIQKEYKEALKINPNLSYEEFMSLRPISLSLDYNEEPIPSSNLLTFKEKYLG